MATRSRVRRVRTPATESDRAGQTPDRPTDRAAAMWPAAPRIVPRVLHGTVNGAEAIAVGALNMARTVLVTAITGTAELGAQVVATGADAARGAVDAVARFGTDLADVASSAARATMRAGADGAAASVRAGPAAWAGRKPLARAPMRRRDQSEGTGATGTAVSAEAPRRRGRRRRVA
jgi:hypothetical protein